MRGSSPWSPGEAREHFGKEGHITRGSWLGGKCDTERLPELGRPGESGLGAKNPRLFC